MAPAFVDFLNPEPRTLSSYKNSGYYLFHHTSVQSSAMVG